MIVCQFWAFFFAGYSIKMAKNIFKNSLFFAKTDKNQEVAKADCKY
jgi:hypothetical protein